MLRRVAPRTLSLIVGISLAATAALGQAVPASAAWSANGSGSGAGAAAVMPAGTAPHGTVSGTSVTVTWSAATLSSGSAVAGYVISRYNATTGTQATVGAGCSGVITTTACTEVGVTGGSWVYRDTPVEVNWTGGQSPDSAPVTVS
jgi:hypothetical protein